MTIYDCAFCIFRTFDLHSNSKRIRIFKERFRRRLNAYVKYIEANPLRANLVSEVGQWPWSSAILREESVSFKAPVIDKGPLELPESHYSTSCSEAELAKIRNSIQRNQPLGSPDWTKKVAKELRLESTLEGHGGPRGKRKTGQGA